MGSKFDSGDLTLLLIGSACSKDLTFAAIGTSELPLTLNFHRNTADSKLQTASRTSGTQGTGKNKHLVFHDTMLLRVIAGGKKVDF